MAKNFKEKLKEKKALLFLALIILLGAFLRFYKLVQVPPSLFGDEVDVGYQAYSILKTGKDYLGQSWPLSFHSLADWRTPLFLYGTVPFVWLFGLTELGVRFQPAFWGFLTIPLFYLLVKKIFKKEILALLAALFLAISPWHLQYSRAAFEVTQMLFLLLLGLYLFLRGLEEKPWFLSLAALCLALTPYSYNTAKLFAPLFIILLVVVFFRQLKKVKRLWLVLAIAVLVLISTPMAYDILFGQGSSRFGYLSIFNNPTTIPEIGFRRLEDLKVQLGEVPLRVTPSLSSRIFHNKFLSWGTTFLTNYFRSFSTEFLFTFGDVNYRHSIQGGFGELFWPDVFFLLLGGFYALTKIREKKIRSLLLAWLLLSPVPSALTQDGGNHATRLILMLPPLLILISFGFYHFLGWFKKRKWRVTVVFLLLVGYAFIFTLYLHRYYVHWPLDSEQWWHPGFKQAAAYVKEHQSEYEQVVWSSRNEPPMIFFLFWMGFEPEKFQQAEFEDVLLNGSIEAKHLVGTKFYFGQMNERYAAHNNYTGALTSKILYIAPAMEVKLNLKEVGSPPGLRVLKIIDLLSKRPAMYLLSN